MHSSVIFIVLTFLGLLGLTAVAQPNSAKEYVLSPTYLPEEPLAVHEATVEQVVESKNSIVYESLAASFQELGERQTAGKRDQLDSLTTQSFDRSEYQLKMAAFEQTGDYREADSAAIIEYLSTEAQDLLVDKFKKYVSPIFDTKQGLSFDFDFSFKRQTEAAKQPAADKLRYGLVLQEVEIDGPAPMLAATGDDLYAEMAYARKANVSWTIGPVEEQSAKPFDVRIQEKQEREFDYWSYIPSPSFKANVVPSGFENYASTGKLDYLLKIDQTEGYYAQRYKVKGGGEPDVEHDINIPMHNYCILSRTFDHNWQVKSTSLLNLRYSPFSPSFNVHYYNAVDRYQVDSQQDVGDVTLDLAYRSRANHMETDANKRFEEVKLGVSTLF